MSTEDNKALYMRYWAALRNPDKLKEVLAPDFVAHDLPPGVTLLQFREMVNEGFPDQKAEVVELIAEGDRIAACWMLSQTHLGKFQGTAPTGKHVTFELLEIVRIKEDKIAERWVQFDRGGLLQQLGVTQSPWQAS
jgi:predicted ester cyclase